jgi:hypothetical protein
MDEIAMEQISRDPYLELEYSQINDNIRFLADVRFKLLALLPILGGAGVFVLSRLGLEAGSKPVNATSDLLIVLLVSVLGFLATLGITLYDQRNSELYNALIHRAKHLETLFDVPGAPGGLKKVKAGGQFNERPRKGRNLVFVAGHDFALALIYGPLLGAWFFPILYSFLLLLGTASQIGQLASIGAAVITGIVFTNRIIALDKQEMHLYQIAAKRDGLKKNEVELDEPKAT